MGELRKEVDGCIKHIEKMLSSLAEQYINKWCKVRELVNTEITFKINFGHLRRTNYIVLDGSPQVHIQHNDLLSQLTTLLQDEVNEQEIKPYYVKACELRDVCHINNNDRDTVVKAVSTISNKLDELDGIADDPKFCANGTCKPIKTKSWKTVFKEILRSLSNNWLSFSDDPTVKGTTVDDMCHAQKNFRKGLGLAPWNDNASSVSSEHRDRPTHSKWHTVRS